MNAEDQSRLKEIETTLADCRELQEDDCDWLISKLREVDGDRAGLQMIYDAVVFDVNKLRAEVERLKGAEFQSRVHDWMMVCFGVAISADCIERNHRFLEESLELVQSCGCTQSEAHQLVDYVFSRSVGDRAQEVGGVFVTLAALCEAQSLNLNICGEKELARIWTKVEAIRAKQASKPKHSPLPQPPTN